LPRARAASGMSVVTTMLVLDRASVGVDVDLEHRD
jgi:hypothetical protein